MVQNGQNTESPYAKVPHYDDFNFRAARFPPSPGTQLGSTA